MTSIGNDAFGFSVGPLTAVRLDGPAPTLGTNSFGSSSPTVSFLWSQTASGYTTPTWSGYSSVAIAVVQYDGNGGTGAPSQEVQVGAAASDPGASSRAGSQFSGWYTAATGGTKFNFADPVSGDLVLYAQFATLAATGVDVVPALPIGAVALLLAGLALIAWVNRRSSRSPGRTTS